MEIDYTDGAGEEAKVLSLLRKATQLGSAVPIAEAEYAEWAVEYHLCPERANLLRPFDFSGLSVLELGAGMGAVSRFLAEAAAHLTVVEGTEQRYAALSQRLRDLKNWKGVVGNLAEVTLEEKFDVVCVVGVLEYSELFIAPEGNRSPFDIFLAKARSFLKDDGVLILAIENKLGLKYWSGATEDHLGTSFSGVCGYPPQKTARTFSRRELKAKLQNAGWVNIDEYFPFPDYKIPSAVVSRAFIANHPQKAAELASSRTSRDYLNGSGARLFPERLAWRNLADSGLLDEMANSFLFFASPRHSPTRDRLLGGSEKLGEQGWYFSNRRRTPMVTYIVEKAGKVFTEKRSLEAGAAVASSETWEAGDSFVHRWYQHGYFDGPAASRRDLVHFLRWSFVHWGVEGRILPAGAVDAVATNALVSGAEYRLFDLEWTLKKEPLTKSWFLLRNLFCLNAHRSVLVKEPGLASLRDWYFTLCDQLGIPEDYEADLSKEAHFQAEVGSPQTAEQHRLELLRLFNSRFPSQGFLHRLPYSLFSGRAHEKFNQLVRGVKEIRRPKGKRHHANAPLMQGTIPGGWVELDLNLVDVGEGSAMLRLQSGDTPLEFPLSLEGRTHLRKVFRLARTIDSARVETIHGPVRLKASSRFRALKKWQVVWRLSGDRMVSWLAGAADFGAAMKELWNEVKQSRFVGAKRWARNQILRDAYGATHEYDAWVLAYDTLSDSDRVDIVRHIDRFAKQPAFSILMPVYNADEEWLRNAIESVVDQLYQNWELCIADDASTAPHVHRVLKEFQESDPRIKVVFREKNGHIAAATNSALELATGEYVVLMDHDDELAEHALYHVAAEINRDAKWDLLYSDEDKIDTEGRRGTPHFKPEWNESLFGSYNLINHLSVIRRSVVESLGGFRSGFEGSQDYDLYWRVIESVGVGRVRHLPFILYHWRSLPDSTAGAATAKSYAAGNARKAIEEHFARTGRQVSVEKGFENYHRVRFPLVTLPRVSAVICSRDKAELLKVVVDGLLNGTDYSNLEILVVNNQSREAASLEYLARLELLPNVRVLNYDAPFNFSAMNNLAAKEATGELLAFLNNDLEVKHRDWLYEMVSLAKRPEMGVVGARLLYPDGRIQHAGVVTGIGAVAGHIHKMMPGDSAGYVGRAQVTQACSAVTAACCVVRRELFERAGGFDGKGLAVAFNDVDLCLRIREMGYNNVFTPYAELFHFESVSRGVDTSPEQLEIYKRECQVMEQRWGTKLRNDPYYNPNLSLEHEDFALAFPPRTVKPWKVEQPEASPSLKQSVYPSYPIDLGGN